MRSVLAASLFVVVAVSGCIDDNTAGTDSTDTLPEEPVEPFHVDESFDLRVWTDSGPDTAQVRVHIETWNDDT